MTDLSLLDLELEEAAIGAVLTNPTLYVLAAEHVQPEYFGHNRVRETWRAIGEALAEDGAVDILSLSRRLAAAKVFVDAKWSDGEIYSWLNQTIDKPVSSMNAELYALLVRRLYLRRTLADRADKIRALAFSEDKPVEQVMVEAENLLHDITGQGFQHTDKSLGDAMLDIQDEVKLRSEDQRSYYMPTGFTALDMNMGGLERGNLHIVGGRPGMGKSSLCAGVAMNAARLGVRVYYLSTEMTVQRLGMRIAAMETGINLQALKRGSMTADEQQRLFEAVTRLQKTSLTLDYVPQATITQVRAKVARANREKGIDLLVIDGLWQMTAPEHNSDERNLVNGWIAAQLLTLAKSDYNIPILIAHQLNRNCEHRADKRPVMSDLEYGGQLEQHADVIMLLYRDEVYNEATEFPNQADIILTKNRDAPPGTVSLYFDKRTTRFVNSTSRTIDIRSYVDVDR